MEICIVGKGSSLAGLDLNRMLKGRTVCGINDVYKVVRCDIICFWDNPRYLYEFHGRVWTIDVHRRMMEQYCSAGRINSFLTFCNHGTDVDMKAGTVPNINLSGILAVSCAILQGYKTIYLFGFDGGYTGKAVFFNSETKHPESKVYEKYNDAFSIFLDKGAKIINVVNPDNESRIVCFEKMNYAEF